MDKIVDHLFVFKGDGIIENFPGNYSDYRAYEDSQVQEKNNSSLIEKKPKNQSKNTNSKSRLNFNEQKELKKIEKDIKKIENQKKEIQNLFINENLNSKEIEDYSIKLGALDQELEKKTLRWFELSEN
jgi:ATP-binding cassette subfamily F protein uup